MSILDRLTRGQRQQLKRATRLARHASEHVSLDQWQLEDYKRDSTRFRERLERPIELKDGRTFEAGTELHEDLFLGAHTAGETRVKPPEEMRPSHQFNRDVLAEFFKTDDHKAAKPFTEGDPLASLIYAHAAGDVLDEFVREQKEQLEQSQDAADIERDLQDVLDALNEARAKAKDAHELGVDPIPQDLTDRVKDLTAQREQLVEQLAGVPAPQPVPGAALEQAAASGRQRVDVWGAIATSGAAELEHISPDEAVALTEQWMQLPDFMELCKLMGRIHRDFRALDARNVIGGDDEIVGIELGNNLTNTLPSELARLGNPLTRRSFMRDFTDESLLQFQTQGSEKVDMGPGVLCIDLSGSMQGHKATEAKAVAIGFVRLMHRKKRDAIVICFNRTVVWEHHFPRRDGLEMEHLLTLAGLLPKGGTNITTAVVRAEQIVGTLPSFKRADVLIVTDGQSPWATEADGVRERFEAAGVRKHGIAIGHTPQPGGWLLKFCDDAISVTDLTEATGDIVRAIS